MGPKKITFILGGIIAIMWLFLIASVIGTIIMFVNLNSKGDERKKAIVLHASSRTFYILATAIGIYFVSQIIRSIFLNEKIIGINPVVAITLTSILYTINLYYYKRKMGN